MSAPAWPTRARPVRLVRTQFASLEQLRRRITTDRPVVATSGEGPLAGWFGLVEAPFLRVTAGALSRGLVSAGSTVEGALTVTVVLEAQGGNIDDVPLERGRVLVHRPGALFRGWSAPGYRWLAVMLPEAVVRQLARRQGWRPPDMADAPLLDARLAEDELVLVEAFARRLGLGPTGSHDARPRLGPEDLEAWGRVLARIWARGRPRTSARRERRGRAALRRTMHWMESHLGERLRVAELCRVAGVPERTLVHMCRRHFGVPPRRLLHVLRLHRARRLLLEPRPAAGGGVRHVARAVGISHAGRFAGSYRRLFGESPRETTRRGGGGPESATKQAGRGAAARGRRAHR